MVEKNDHFCNLDVSMREYGTPNNPHPLCDQRKPMFQGSKWSGNVKNAKQAFPQCAGDQAQGRIPVCLSPPPSSIHPPNLHPWLFGCSFVDIINPVMFLLLAA